MIAEQRRRGRIGDWRQAGAARRVDKIRGAQDFVSSSDPARTVGRHAV
jgi:hypothetical protein